MTNYSAPQRSTEYPWAKSLEAGDLLLAGQAACVDPTRLRDFGLELAGIGGGRFEVVRAQPRPSGQWWNDIPR